MKKALKFLGWSALGLVVLAAYFAFPDFQRVLGIAGGCAFAYHLMKELVESTIRRVLWDELLELRQQSNANTDRLETIDRKVTAILSDALERRRGRPI
jgi:hypothetical protein